MAKLKVFCITCSILIISLVLVIVSVGNADVKKVKDTRHHQHFKISGSLHVTPAQYKGKCPKEFKFRGIISVSGITEPVTIKYKFNRNDGASMQEQELIFDKNGSKTVNDSWEVGSQGEKYSGWEELVVTQPHHQAIGKAHFRCDCKK
jgi:hypothetical protein